MRQLSPSRDGANGPVRWQSSEIVDALAAAVVESAITGVRGTTAAPVTVEAEPWTGARACTAAEVRAAEAPLLAAEVPLMQRAAAALAAEVRMLRPRDLLVLTGSGDNGGDALYAAAELAGEGVPVRLWPTGSRVHEATSGDDGWPLWM